MLLCTIFTLSVSLNLLVTPRLQDQCRYATYNRCTGYCNVLACNWPVCCAARYLTKGDVRKYEREIKESVCACLFRHGVHIHCLYVIGRSQNHESRGEKTGRVRKVEMERDMADGRFETLCF